MVYENPVGEGALHGSRRVGWKVEVPGGPDEGVVVRAARRRARRGQASPNDIVFAAVGVGVRIWIAVVATLALGVGAFISIAAVGEIHHENGCSQYHNALVAITADLKLVQKPNTQDLNILTPNERHN